MRALLAHRLLAHVRLLCLLVAWGLSATLASPSQAASCSHSRLADEIFEINVRPAGCTTDPERLAARLVVNEYALADSDGSRKWLGSDLARATTPSSPDMLTIVFVHGNKVDSCYARQRSMRVYRTLVRRAGDGDRPIRFVIFSWPATEVNGFLNDFRVKAARTRPLGWQLAWVLNHMPADANVSLLGYSYGARIVGGAMHVLAGGDLTGLALDNPQPHRPMRVAFLAAATHAHWFGPNCYHGLAMHQIDRLMLLNNELDPAMRFYHFVETNSNPQAMGLCGPTCLSAEARARVVCYDCSNCVGRSHDLFKYMATGCTITRVWDHLTYAD